MKPNCYKCIHRGTLLGSVHSCCNHPKATKNSSGTLEGLFAALSGGSCVSGDSEILNIKANERGKRSGWFNWPSNFDPIWLENCDGFEEKKEDDK